MVQWRIWSSKAYWWKATFKVETEWNLFHETGFTPWEPARGIRNANCLRQVEKTPKNNQTKTNQMQKSKRSGTCSTKLIPSRGNPPVELRTVKPVPHFSERPRIILYFIKTKPREKHMRRVVFGKVQDHFFSTWENHLLHRISGMCDSPRNKKENWGKSCRNKSTQNWWTRTWNSNNHIRRHNYSYTGQNYNTIRSIHNWNNNIKWRLKRWRKSDSATHIWNIYFRRVYCI